MIEPTYTVVDLFILTFAVLSGMLFYYEILKPFVRKQFARYKDHVESRKALNKKQEFYNGYGWAMAEARLCNRSINYLEMHTMSHLTNETCEFENGIKRAVQDLTLIEFGESIEVPD
jgi:hypothetical protein